MRNNKRTERLPDKVEMEGPHLWWGNVMLATVHDNIRVTVEPAELKRYIRLHKHKLQRKQASKKPRH